MADILSSPQSAEAQIADNNRDSITNAAIAGSSLAGSSYLLKKYGGTDSTLANFYQKLLGTEFLQRQLDQAPSWVDSGGSKFTNQSVMKSMLSQLMAIEEASPLHILRTLQLSNILQPFVDITQSEQEIKFSTRKIKNQYHYYKTLIEFANKDADAKMKSQLVEKALANGMTYKGGRLYANDLKGNIDKGTVLVNQARLALSNIKQGEINSPSMMAAKYAESIGAKIDLDLMKSDPLMVIGAGTRKELAAKWGQGWLRYAVEMGMKSLDNPLSGVEEMLKGVAVDQTSFFESKFWKTAKKYTNIQLGTNGDYTLGIGESLKRSAKNVAIKSTGVALGYEILDSVARTIAPSDGLFSEGLYTGLTNIYAGARVKFAEVWSDRFQGYKDSQEEAAKGSTNLTTLLALPLSGALFGAQLSYFGRIGKTVTSNTDEAAKKYNVSRESETLSKFGMKEKMKPVKRNALIGALAGAAVALPFLPGALVGESSEELRQLYSGEKEVAQKANRWWMFGGSKWEGSHTQYFAKHNVARVNADAVDKVRYGDDDTKKKLNPLLHPLAYLKDPYRYEKMHAEDMPYPVWGMDVNYGSIYGKVFERTVGQIIKPDIINPLVKEFTDHKEGETLKQSVLKSAYRFLVGNKENVGGSLSMPVNISPQDQGLINAGVMAAPPSGRYSPNLEAAGLTYQSSIDLIGLKGWVGSMPLASIGVDPANVPLQLARSGEATSPARDLVDANVGDMFGFGEFQRKILGTSSGSLPERLNPLANDMTYWLPSSDNQYYINFAKGNPYSHIKNGEERLPGVGFAALNPEVKGVDPDDYSLVYKYKVLSDVAKGSREHIRARQDVLSAYNAGSLSKREVEIVKETMDQEVQRDNRKEFYEPSSIGQRAGFGPVGYLQSSVWDFVSKHGESPTEMLTPIRPMAKFMHNRTAIEDYVATQLGGSDSGIWTNPYSHFLKPAANKTRLLIDRSFKGEEVREKENIEEYFDKLDHVRSRYNGNTTKDFSSTVSSSMSGLNTNEKVLKFKKSLSDDERDYFDAFSKETDSKKRDMIRSILPSDVLRGYEQIWRNVDIAQEARSKGGSVQQAIAHDLHLQTLKLQDSFGITLSKEELENVKHSVYNNRDSYADMGFSLKDRIKYSADEAIRLKMADMEATTYLKNSTGVPSSKFMGWDPRLQTDDIKIRTLSVGNEDLRRFGFWKKDEDRMNRIPALADEDEVIHSINRIKADMRSNNIMKKQIEMTMFNNGFKASRINVVDSDYGSLRIKEE